MQDPVTAPIPSRPDHYFAGSVDTIIFLYKSGKNHLVLDPSKTAGVRIKGDELEVIGTDADTGEPSGVGTLQKDCFATIGLLMHRFPSSVEIDCVVTKPQTKSYVPVSLDLYVGGEDPEKAMDATKKVIQKMALERAKFFDSYRSQEEACQDKAVSKQLQNFI